MDNGYYVYRNALVYIYDSKRGVKMAYVLSTFDYLTLGQHVEGTSLFIEPELYGEPRPATLEDFDYFRVAIPSDFNHGKV